MVEQVHPVAGMRFGGTLVTVYGSGFIGDAAARCRFADVAVVARLLTPKQLECLSPLPAVAGYVSVEVSFNGQDYSTTGVHFEYQPPVAIRALEPSRGPIEGGTFVNVTGSGFSPRAALLGYVWCRFNSTSVAAAWRSSTELHCIAPRHAAGSVGVELTQNEQQYTADGVRYEFEVVVTPDVARGVLADHPGLAFRKSGLVRIDVVPAVCTSGTWSATGTHPCVAHTECATAADQVQVQAAPSATHDRVCNSTPGSLGQGPSGRGGGGDGEVAALALAVVLLAVVVALAAALVPASLQTRIGRDGPARTTYQKSWHRLNGCIVP